MEVGERSVKGCGILVQMIFVLTHEQVDKHGDAKSKRPAHFRFKLVLIERKAPLRVPRGNILNSQSNQKEQNDDFLKIETLSDNLRSYKSRASFNC